MTTFKVTLHVVPKALEYETDNYSFNKDNGTLEFLSRGQMYVTSAPFTIQHRVDEKPERK